ncbi:adenosylmethionine decarboxylase [Thermodesulfobacteriota bacterium]
MGSLLDLVLLDLYECNHARLVEAETIKKAMIEAAERMGAEVRGHSFHTFKPLGVSGTVTIAESHMAVHTWPEYNFAAVTFETCGRHMDHQKAGNYLIEFFGSKRPKMTYQKRGFFNTADGEIDYKLKAC